MDSYTIKSEDFRHRAQIEAHIETLIAILDELDGDCDLEPYLGDAGDDREADYHGSASGVADDEPSFGFLIGREGEGRPFEDASDQIYCLDLEQDDCDSENDGYDEREGDSSDDEPSLGWTAINQRMSETWNFDHELDPAERGVADQDALDDINEQLRIYQHYQALGDREHHQIVCDNIASEARSLARRVASQRSHGSSQPRSLFGISTSGRVGDGWGTGVQL